MDTTANQIKILLIYRINVGGLSRVKSSEYMQSIINSFKSQILLPEHVKLIAIPDNNDTSFEVIDLSMNSDSVNIEEIENILEGGEKEELINVRISKIEKNIFLQKCKKYGFKHLSEYLRFVGLNSNIDVK